MKYGWLSSILFLILMSVSVQSMAATPYKTLRLNVGEQVPLSTKYSVKRSAIGNPEVATLKVLNSREFLLTAKQLGSTQLLLWQGGSEPTVFRIDVVPAAAPGNAAGVAIDARGDRIVLEGQPKSLSQHSNLLGSVGENEEGK